MKILFVRSPRYLWPVINESDNFLMPLAYPCLAAVLKEKLENIEVKIIDCLPLKIGWKSLRRIMEKEKADIVAVGDETIYIHEGAKVLKMAKEIKPETITIGGGHFYSHMIEYSFNKYPLDYIVLYEGEYTLLELVKNIMKYNGKPPYNILKKIKGIAFKNKDGKIIRTPPRPLIENLDELPMPAYELLPMNKYAPFGKLWPRSATVYHSRGCIGHCSFCSLWVQMGDHKIVKGQHICTPRWRTKSVEKTLEEVETLYYKYKRKYLFWIDETWNVDPKWSEKFCEGVIERGIEQDWWLFLRSDFIIRDEKLGVMKKIVDAGLAHAFIGVERALDAQLKELDKGSYSREQTEDAWKILRIKYPHVFRQGTFVTGIRSETKETMLEQVRYAIKLGIDYPAFHTITPHPGTPLYEKAKKEKWIEVEDFSQFDWYTPVMSSQYLSRDEIAKLNVELNKIFVLMRPHWAVKGLFSRSKIRRSIYQWFLYVTVKMAFNMMKERLASKKTIEKWGGFSAFMRLQKPKWYDS
jgi:anaerobic magnesium-protoporphyrin IX monomethyl ester cyclase